ncbi:MAG: hypothetical protein ABIW84_06735 [Ilumatobacteraceae bacterium]
MNGKMDALSYNGALTVYGACEFPEKAVLGIDSMGEVLYLEGKAAKDECPPENRYLLEKYGHLMVLHEPNGFVSNGLDVTLNRLFGVSGPPAVAQCVIVAKSSVAVASTDTSILGGATAPVFTTASQNAFSKVFGNPAASAAASNAITVGIDIADTDITGAANFWPMNRVGLVNVAAATNLGLLDVIGNTAAQGVPYSRTFSIDFSAAGTFTLNPRITITGLRGNTAFPTL